MNSIYTDGKFFFIINPISGNGKAKKRFPIIEEYLIKNNIKYEKSYTEFKGHASSIAKQVKDRNDIKAVVAVGGDGTLFEVINGLYRSNIPVGYIPNGTGNDYGRQMNISTDPLLALQRILKYDIKKIDIGRINQHYFVNVASMGFDAEVVKFVNDSNVKALFGKFAYTIGAIKILIKFKPKQIKLTVDNVEYNYDNVWLIAVANNKYYGGGMLISPDSLNNDGLFDICIIKGLTKLKFLKLFTSVFKGEHVKHYPLVEFIKGKELKIVPQDELIIQTDGEILTKIDLSFENLNQELYIL